MNYRLWLWLAISGAPLLIYPIVLAASAMSLGGTASQPAPMPQLLTSQAFLWGAMFYPVVYLYCATMAIRSREAKPQQSVNMAALPILYVAIEAALFCGWMITSQRGSAKSRAKYTRGE